MKHYEMTRLAPSPTGALHLGNARTFLVNWLMARQNNWKILFRMEDLDGPRVKKEAGLLAIEDLAWLGLDWDETAPNQSTRIAVYREKESVLTGLSAAYPCVCTRSEIAMAASAPHAEDGASIYPGTCFGKYKNRDEARAISKKEPAIRFHFSAGTISIIDGFQGLKLWNPEKELGDFVIFKGDGTPAYQLAVVVDDHEAAVTQVVRGDDLLDSVPRQIALYKAQGWEDSIPKYWHLPLVVGEDGKRLAKRHGDTRLATYRDKGVKPERMLGLLAGWCGMPREEISLKELLAGFDINKMPREKVIHRGAEDDGWLLGGR